jgi:hypothetical protein
VCAPQVDKLVRNFKYPEILRSFTFSWDYMMKGLIIDKVGSSQQQPPVVSRQLSAAAWQLPLCTQQE